MSKRGVWGNVHGGVQGGGEGGAAGRVHVAVHGELYMGTCLRGGVWDCTLEKAHGTMLVSM